MMDKLFSIIIPCYNAVDYLNHSIGSAIAQSIDSGMYEIIAVNDASTDDTLSALRSWQQRYPDMIRVITYDVNLRQGGARNRAIREAAGEYICFLDSDDRLKRDALETYKDLIEETGADIVTSGYDTYEGLCFSDDEDQGKDHEPVKPERIFDNDRDMAEYISADLGFVWSSAYRRSIITYNEVWFPEHLAYEDIYWQRLIKFYAKRACTVNAVTHDYLVRPGSTMNSRNASHHVDRLTCYEMLLDEYSKRNLIQPYYDRILKDTMESYVFNSYYMFFKMMDDIPDVYERIRSTVYKYFPDWETSYDDSEIPMVFQYLLKFLKKAKSAKPADLQPFKDAILELSAE